MITLDTFKKFDFRHLTTKEFFELEGMITQLLMERDVAVAQNKEWKRTKDWKRP